MPASANLPETILVVEDEDPVSRVIVRLLERQGYRTLVARNGSEAVHLYAEYWREITAATMDLMMPTTSGRDALAMLSQFAPQLPIVIVSAVEVPDDLIGRKPGSPGITYVRKPFDGKVLEAAIRRVMREMLGATSERRAPKPGDDATGGP